MFRLAPWDADARGIRGFSGLSGRVLRPETKGEDPAPVQVTPVTHETLRCAAVGRRLPGLGLLPGIRACTGRIRACTGGGRAGLRSIRNGRGLLLGQSVRSIGGRSRGGGNGLPIQTLVLILVVRELNLTGTVVLFGGLAGQAERWRRSRRGAVLPSTPGLRSPMAMTRVLAEMSPPQARSCRESRAACGGAIRRPRHDRP